MRKIIVSMHITLGGFVAGPNGEMNWIRVDDEMFNLGQKMTDEADASLYGRVTYEMMNSFWPTAGEQPNASKFHIEHSRWYNQSLKIVLSTTLSEKGLDKTKIQRIANFWQLTDFGTSVYEPT
jgi:dihydrofolate reductase